MEVKTDRQVISFPRIPVTLVQGVVKLLFICYRKNCEKLGQRFILANELPKDTLLTYGVRFYFVFYLVFET